MVSTVWSDLFMQRGVELERGGASVSTSESEASLRDGNLLKVSKLNSGRQIGLDVSVLTQSEKGGWNSGERGKVTDRGKS